MIADIVYALCALVAVFIPMGFAWAVVRWTTKRKLDSDSSGRRVPQKLLHPLRRPKPRHPLRRVDDTHERRRSSSGD
jgi:hypothetical protein